MSQIYFDFNATTPLAPEAAAAMRPFLDGQFGNASSHHWAGERAKRAVDLARGQVAALLHCQESEVVFTSGGTESNNSALSGVFFGPHGRKSPHFIVSCIEHPSISRMCDFLERLGAVVTHLRVDPFGRVDPDDVRRAMTPDTVLVSVMHSNNEVGTIQPIKEIALVAKGHGVLMHTDAAQSIAKVVVDVAELGVDLLTVAGHKMYAPQGIGALFVRRGTVLTPLMHGGGHEAGRRSGTENLLEIVALGAASAVATQDQSTHQILALRDYFWSQLLERLGTQVRLNGHPQQRLPNTLNVSFLGHGGQKILSQIPELAASTGSACHAGEYHVSPVLQAMGVSIAAGAGAIRFSLGRSTTRREIDHVVRRLSDVLSKQE